jgi:NAD+ synthase (glutamine-hydrolysing)
MNALLCQTNTTPGDFASNVQQIKDCIEEGIDKEVDLIIFPELSIPGYLCRDMMHQKGFIEKNLSSLQEITQHYKSCMAKKSPHVVVGYIDRNTSGSGKPFRNMAAVIKDGIVIATYAKHLLPFYDVFDEGRYFEPGTELTVVEIAGKKWGIAICEDVWNDKGSDDYNYNKNPLSEYRNIGIKNIISINSSPYVKGKPDRRIDVLKKGDFDSFIYVNQVGGQDELVFDGHSFVLSNGGLVTYMNDEISASATLMPLKSQSKLWNDTNSKYLLGSTWRCDTVVKSEKQLYDVLKMGLRDYIHKSGFKEVVVGSSGGIDSALVLALACDAIGAKNVHAIRMPSIHSSQGSRLDALQLHKNLGCHDYLINIDHIDLINHIVSNVKVINSDMRNRDYNKIADENIQARLRGNIVMHFSNAWGALPLTTGNKTELALGYCSIFGDMAGGFAPINDLYKMDVYSMAEYVNSKAHKEIIPDSILAKAPSAELAPNQTDEGNLKLPYVVLDKIVESYIEDYVGDFNNFRSLHDGNKNLKEWFKQDSAKAEYEHKIKLIDRNEFKRRQAAPGIKVCKVAFGTGRRLPIVKK